MSRRKRHHPAAQELAFMRSADAAWWLDTADDALRRATREMAQRLDELSKAIDAAPALIRDPAAAAQVVSKTAYGLQMYTAALRELGMTPASRDAIAVGDDSSDDPFAEGRALIADILAGPGSAAGDPDAAAVDSETA